MEISRRQKGFLEQTSLIIFVSPSTTTSCAQWTQFIFICHFFSLPLVLTFDVSQWVGGVCWWNQQQQKTECRRKKSRLWKAPKRTGVVCVAGLYLFEWNCGECYSDDGCSFRCDTRLCLKHTLFMIAVLQHTANLQTLSKFETDV